MLRVITIMPGNEHESAKPRVNEFAMTTLSASDAGEACALQVNDQLSNLARHTDEAARNSRRFPAS